MAADVQTEIVIRRPRNEVASFAANPENAPTWYANIEEAKLLTPPPVARGSRVAFVAHFLGKRLEYTYEIVEFVPGQRIVMRTSQGPFPMETTYMWETVDGEATRMTLRNHGEPRGFSKVAAPLMIRAMRKANEKDLARLKELLEAEP